MQKSVMKQHGIDKNRLARKMQKSGRKNVQPGLVVLSDEEIEKRKKMIEEILTKHNVSLPDDFKIKKTDTFEEKIERMTLFCFDTYKSIIKFWEIDAKVFNQASSYSKLEELEDRFEKFVDDEDNNKILVKNNKL